MSRWRTKQKCSTEPERRECKMHLVELLNVWWHWGLFRPCLHALVRICGPGSARCNFQYHRGHWPPKGCSELSEMRPWLCFHRHKSVISRLLTSTGPQGAAQFIRNPPPFSADTVAMCRRVADVYIELRQGLSSYQSFRTPASCLHCKDFLLYGKKESRPNQHVHRNWFVSSFFCVFFNWTVIMLTSLRSPCSCCFCWYKTGRLLINHMGDY